MTTAPVDYNPFDPAVHADPYPSYRALREHAPVHWNPPGMWVVTRYADVAALLRDPRCSSDPSKSGLLADLGLTEGSLRTSGDIAPSMLFVDPPAHRRLRGLVNKAFTQRVVERLRPRVAALVAELLDSAAARGEMDVVADLAYPVPLTVICELLGVPPADRAQFRPWSDALIRLLDPFVGPDLLAPALAARAELRGYFAARIAELERRPGDDLLSGLVSVRLAGERLSQQELLSMCVLLLLAGHETTVHLIAGGTVSLLQNRAALERLRADPGLGRSAVEELLRYVSPVQLTSRAALEDLVVGENEVAAGQELLLLLGAANRDPATFPEPDRLDLGRTDNRHVAFGGGIHFCLGAPLARMEAELALGELLRRFPAIELEVDPVPLRDTVTLRGPSSVPVSLGTT